MSGRRYAAFLIMALAGLSGCGSGPVFAAPRATPPVNPNGPGFPDPSRSISPISGTPPVSASPRSLPAGSGFGSAPTSPAPRTTPTVAKTQKWVKIFSGPSATDLAPPATRAGSRTVELNATPSDAIGTYVSDGAGRTLYRFDKDPAKKSVCNGDCAVAWPPLLIKSPGSIFPDGVDPRRIGYLERADHHCQVTIDGHPVYSFVADAAAGQINGQGINGTWFAITPSGGRTAPIPGRRN